MSQRSFAPQPRSNTSDETGIRIAARTHWLHVLCTPLLTVLRIATGRSHFDEELTGIVIHDDYASYFALEGVRHGACNAHHLRELQALIEIEKEDWATSTHRLPHPRPQSRPLRP